MNATRLASIAALSVGSVGAAWLLWPRPDLSIEVDRGGVATVVDLYGRRSSLDDTVFVGGSGARRTVRVINRDSVRHQLAMFAVQPGAQVDYTVPLGTFGGFCSAHLKRKTLTIVVR